MKKIKINKQQNLVVADLTEVGAYVDLVYLCTKDAFALVGHVFAPYSWIKTGFILPEPEVFLSKKFKTDFSPIIIAMRSGRIGDIEAKPLAEDEAANIQTTSASPSFVYCHKSIGHDLRRGVYVAKDFYLIEKPSTSNDGSVCYTLLEKTQQRIECNNEPIAYFAFNESRCMIYKTDGIYRVVCLETMTSFLNTAYEYEARIVAVAHCAGVKPWHLDVERINPRIFNGKVVVLEEDDFVIKN